VLLPWPFPLAAEIIEVSPTDQLVAFLRKRAAGIAVVLALSVAAQVSLAQTLLPQMGDVLWPGLTQDDIDRMHAAGARLYEDRSIGNVERWRSPDTKDAGEVKLTRSFTARGMPCRSLEYTVRFDNVRDNPSHYVLNWCKTESGEWKIVELPHPH
jgi:surface antigen